MVDRLQTAAFPVRVGDGEELRPVHLEAISPEGLFVRTRDPCAVDGAVRIELDPPDGSKKLTLDGRVARIEPASGEMVAGVEIRFVGLSRDTVTGLAALLASCEDLSDEAEAEIEQVSVATVLRRRIDNAARHIERTERHLVQLERGLEFARQAERASRTLVEQIEANRESAAPDDSHADRLRQLGQRRKKLDSELNRRLGSDQIHQQIERQLARVNKLTGELEEVRGHLQQTKTSSASRLEDARGELEAEKRLRAEAEAQRAELESELAAIRSLPPPPPVPPPTEAAEANESAEVEQAEPEEVELESAEVEVEPESAGPPPPPSDAVEEEEEGPAVDLASAIAGELLTGSTNDDDGAAPVELQEAKPAIPALRPPPRQPASPASPGGARWLHLLGATLVGSGLVVVAAVGFLHLRGGDRPSPLDDPAADTSSNQAAAAVEPEVESTESETSTDSAVAENGEDAEPNGDPAATDAATEEPSTPTEPSAPVAPAAADEATTAPVESDEEVEDNEPPLAVEPPSPEELLATALELYERKRFKPALKAFRIAAPGNPRSHELHAGMGHCLLELGRAKQAVTHLERATKLKATSPTAYMYLGTAYWELERKEDARAAFERFLELAPKSPRAGEIRTLLKSL